MKTISTYFIKSFILLVCVLASSQVYAWKPIMIGNNGCCKGVENTEEAFINAATEYGFQGIKTVVQVTNDNRYVCWSNGKANNDIIPKDLLSNKDYDVDISGNSLRSMETCQLQQTRTMEDLNTTQTFTGKICTVDRFFEICKEYNVFPLIELHWTKAQFDQWFSGLYDLIYEYGMVNRVIISTPTQEILTYLNTYHPEFQQSQRQYFINHKITDADITFCISNKCDISACYWIKSDEKITLNDVTKCHNAGVKVAAWAPYNISGYEGYGVHGLNYIISSELGPNKVELPELEGEDPNYVDNSTRTIYFRPSTVVTKTGYYSGVSNCGELGNTNVAWTKSDLALFVVEKTKNGEAKYHRNNGTNWLNNDIVVNKTVGRFLPFTIGVNSSFAMYRGQNNASTVESLTSSGDTPSGGNVYNSIPNNEWWKKSPQDSWDKQLISVNEDMKDHNLIGIDEGYWAGGYCDDGHYYLGYFLEKATQIYFAKHGEVNANWDTPYFVRGKNIYAYKHAMQVITGTRLYFLELTPGFGIDNGIAYTDYGFIGKIDKWGSYDEDDNELWKNYATTNNMISFDDAQAKSLQSRFAKTGANEISPRTNLRQDLLTGMNLFVPGTNSVDDVDKQPLTSWRDLNHTLSVYAQPSCGSTLTCTSYKLTNAQTAVADANTTGFTAATFGMAYTASVTITAEAKEGFKFEGWYVNTIKVDGTMEGLPAICKTNYTATKDGNTQKLTFNAPNTDISVVAKFVPIAQTQAFSVLTYNPNVDKFIEYTTGNAGKITIQYTDQNGTTKTTETESSCVLLDAKDATNVSLTATLTNDEYEFLGWYDYTTDSRLQEDTVETYTYQVSPSKIIQARFAPKECWTLRLDPNIGGTFTVQFSKNANFIPSQSTQSSYSKHIYTKIPYEAYLNLSSIQPVVGYTAKSYKVGGRFEQIGKHLQATKNGHNVQVELVRKDDQIVYLNLRGSGGNISAGWNTSTPDEYAYYAFVYNDFKADNVLRKWIRMEHDHDYCYKCTIPGNLYNRVNFVQICLDSEGRFITNGSKPENAPDTIVDITLDNNTSLDLNYVRDTLKIQRRRSGFNTIPATNCNCYRLSALYKSGGWVDFWTTPPTNQNDYRILYREQTVKSKTEIEIDY